MPTNKTLQTEVSSCTLLQARALAEIINSGIQPLQNVNVRKKVGEEKAQEWVKYWIERGLTGISVWLTIERRQNIISKGKKPLSSSNDFRTKYFIF